MSMIVKLLRVTNAEFEAYRNDSSLLEKRIYGDTENDPAMINIDKSWEGILFLLTGQGLKKNKHPMSRVFFSGQNVDEGMDLGYGPAEYLLPEQVKELEAQLSVITAEALTEKFDPEQMTTLGIYPNIWQEEEVVYYLLAYFREVQAFFATAAVNDEAIITGLI